MVELGFYYGLLGIMIFDKTAFHAIAPTAAKASIGGLLDILE